MHGAKSMTLFGRCQRHERIEHFRMCFWIDPILPYTFPLGPQPLPRGIGILDDESLHPLRMRRNDAEADRPAIVMKVEGALVDLELLKEVVDRPGQVVKGICVRRWRRRVALTESWEIRCYQMIMCGEQGNERIELARGGGKAVQQHDRRRVLGTSLPIEDTDAINHHAVIGRCG